jgi:hypothetical protein
MENTCCGMVETSLSTTLFLRAKGCPHGDRFCPDEIELTREKEIYAKPIEIGPIVELYPLFGECDLIAKVEADSYDAIGAVAISKIRSDPRRESDEAPRPCRVLSSTRPGPRFGSLFDHVNDLVSRWRPQPTIEPDLADREREDGDRCGGQQHEIPIGIGQVQLRGEKQIQREAPDHIQSFDHVAEHIREDRMRRAEPILRQGFLHLGDRYAIRPLRPRDRTPLANAMLATRIAS